ncbi:VanZ family protein [Acidobacteriota bacterium]
MSLPQNTPSFTFHLLSYIVWAFLLCGAIRNRYWSKLTIGMILTFLPIFVAFAAFQECLQYLNPARHPSLPDLGINVAGSLIGLLITHMGAFLICVEKTQPQKSVQ